MAPSIRVRTRSGHRADERPTAVDLDGSWVEVDRVLDAWIERPAPVPSGEPQELRFFRLQTVAGARLVVRHDAGADTWELVSQSGAPTPPPRTLPSAHRSCRTMPRKIRTSRSSSRPRRKT